MQHIVNRIRAFLAAQAAIEVAIRASGLTPPQYVSLMALSTNGSMTMGQLGSAIGAACSTMTDLIDRAERGGVMCRVRSLEDRRIVTIVITPKGQAALDQVNAALAPLFEGMPLEVMEWLVGVSDATARQMAAV